MRVTDAGAPPLSANTVIPVIVGDGIIAPASHLAGDWPPAGALPLTLTGVTAGQRWDVQTWIDLVQWITVTRLRAENDVLSYEDRDTKSQPARFYRLAKTE